MALASMCQMAACQVAPLTLLPCPPARPAQAHRAVKQAENKIRQLREALEDESARKEVCCFSARLPAG